MTTSRKLRKAVRYNFVACVWLMILWCLVVAVLDIKHLPRQHGMWELSVTGATWRAENCLLWAGLQLLFWFVAYRHAGARGKICALFTGITLSLPMIAAFFTWSDPRVANMIDWPYFFLLLYLALSHLSYAIFSRNESEERSCGPC
jgi:hypothetical protein